MLRNVLFRHPEYPLLQLTCEQAELLRCSKDVPHNFFGTFRDGTATVSVSRAISLEQSPAPSIVTAFAPTEELCTKQMKLVEALKPSWEGLPSICPMQSYIWAQSCAAVLSYDDLHVFTDNAKSPRAIAVLAESAGSDALVPLGNELCEPTEFAYADADAAGELSEAIVRSGRALSIRDVYADSVVLRSMQRAAGRRLIAHPFAGHPYLELDDSWLEPESHLNSGRRSDLRRALRNAERLGPVYCEVVSPTPANLAPLLREAFNVEAKGWKGLLGSALAIDPKVGSFYTRFAEEACKAGTLRIGMLRIGDRPAAMQFGIEQNGCFWLFKMGFDESFARFSPGSLLFVESVRAARQRGCHRFEMMGRGEAWNRIWSPQFHEAVTVNLCADSARGWITGLTERTTGVLKTTVRKSMGDRSIGHRVREILLPMVRFAARSYIAGPELNDALTTARALADRGRGSTIGFWDEVGAAPSDVLDAYVQLARSLQNESLDSYVSVKAPSVQYSADALTQVISECKSRQTRLHFDSLWLDSVEPTCRLIDTLLPQYRNVSCTLPGRWKRSVDDAEWAIDRGIGVRVVKGQWADPATPLFDPHEGFLNVIQRLAGRARSVAVATHCPKLAASALQLLIDSGTPCELELLYGLPSGAVLRIAKSMNIKTRIYVPYGCGWLPYSLLQMRRNPRILWWVFRDALRGKSNQL